MFEEDEPLEQYDYSTNDYLYQVEEEYAHLIGLFLIRFSELEHELNISIAEVLNDRSHEAGFVVIENLNISNKIQLFYKFYLRHVSILGKEKHIEKLDGIRKTFEEINTFRNKIVHANWQSLNKEGMVRTKITVDKQEGYVLFKKIQIFPKTIKYKIKAVEKLTLNLNSFVELVQNL